MSNASPGFEAVVKIIPQSAGTKFNSTNNAGGEDFDADGDSEVLAPAYSAEWSLGYNTLDATTFEDVAEAIDLGLKTGDLSIDINWSKTNPAGQQTFRQAFDNGEIIEVAFAPDADNFTAGYEKTAHITELPMSAEVSGKVELGSTLQCADGDGWARLTSS